MTAFTSIMHLKSNTPNQKGSTRAQIQQFGDNFLMTDDPASPLYYKYNFYSIPTDFEYFGVRTLLGNGWSIDNKIYTMRYYNKQNYNGMTSITTTSATDKLNSYRKYGNNLPVTYVSSTACSAPACGRSTRPPIATRSPSDPRTWIDAALPNFHEMFGTTTLQPYAEYSWRALPNLTITPGIKYAYYRQNLTQFADNGKTVGNLNGAPSVNHVAEYHAWLPSIDAHLLVQPNWSMYAQYGKGQNIPPSSVFDVKNAQVGTLPEPILTDTYQVGSVWKSHRATLDVDFYHITFQSDYSSTIDTVTGDTVYFLNGESVTKGVEAESTILVGGGLAVYLNAHQGHREVHRHRSLGAERAERHRDDRPDLQPGQLERRLLQQAGRPDVQRQRQPAPGDSDRSVQHHQPVRQLHRARIVAAVAVAHPAGAQQPDRQPRHHGGQPGVGEVQRGGARRHPDADGGPQRLGVVHRRRHRQAVINDRKEPQRPQRSQRQTFALRSLRSLRFLLNRHRSTIESMA